MNTRWIIVSMSALAVLPAAAFGVDLQPLPESYPYPEPAWSPYLVGALIGLLTLVSLVVAKKPVGASSAYAEAAGVIGRVVAPRHIASLPFYKEKEHAPKIGWSMLFVLGAVVGAFIAASTGGEITGTYLQDMWVARFGADSAGLRTALAFLGGAVMAYGARLAGGCTSGHGISGTLQLAVSSWISVICFFIGGIAVALLLYRVDW